MTTETHSRSRHIQPTPSYSKSMRLTQFPVDSQQFWLYQSAGSRVKSGSGQNPRSPGVRASHRVPVRDSGVLRLPAFPHGLDVFTRLSISSVHSEMGARRRVGSTKPPGSTRLRLLLSQRPSIAHLLLEIKHLEIFTQPDG